MVDDVFDKDYYDRDAAAKKTVDTWGSHNKQDPKYPRLKPNKVTGSPLPKDNRDKEYWEQDKVAQKAVDKRGYYNKQDQYEIKHPRLKPSEVTGSPFPSAPYSPKSTSLATSMNPFKRKGK